MSTAPQVPAAAGGGAAGQGRRSRLRIGADADAAAALRILCIYAPLLGCGALWLQAGLYEWAPHRAGVLAAAAWVSALWAVTALEHGRLGPRSADRDLVHATGILVGMVGLVVIAGFWALHWMLGGLADMTN